MKDNKAKKAVRVVRNDVPDQGEGLPERERKDRVLQARVSTPMYEDLVAQARRLRVPVSNLIRNIIEDSLKLVENIVDSGIEIAEALNNRVDAKELVSVVGWQPLLANKRLVCPRCSDSIDKGSQAYMSVGAPSGRTLVICEKCKSEV